MRAGFSVKCIREMPHGRCVLVQVPEDVPLHASVGRRAKNIFDRGRGRRQTGRYPGCMCQVRKRSEPLYCPSHLWLHAGRVRVTVADVGNSMDPGLCRNVQDPGWGGVTAAVPTWCGPTGSGPREPDCGCKRPSSPGSCMLPVSHPLPWSRSGRRDGRGQTIVSRPVFL